MANDTRIRWELASPWGIQIPFPAPWGQGIGATEPRNTWWSGRVFDLVELDGGEAGLLLGTETGGVWSLDRDNSPLPLSNNWENPDVNCLAAGPDGSRHFFSGCVGGVIYETEASTGVPLLAWTPVTASLPVGAGDVYDIAILSSQRLIIAACSGGLYSSNIPPKTTGVRPPYRWIRSDEADVKPGGYFSVTVGLTTESRHERPVDLEEISIVAGGLTAGVFIGRWSAGKLSLKRAEIAGEDFSKSDGPSSVASCDQFPQTLYAACALSDGRLHMIVRSSDGGQTWTPTKNELKNRPGEDIRKLAGEQGAGSAPNNCIAVMPSNPAVVAFGWQNGPFVSTQQGQTWEQALPIHHPDIHALLFKPMLDGDHRLYIGSDGGLAQIRLKDVLLSEGETVKILVDPRSDYNKRLATLQCYSAAVTRQFYGTMSVSRAGTGWISVGLHDNGNVYCNLTGFPKPWQQLEAGDGGWTGITADGGLVSSIKGEVAGFSRPSIGGGGGAAPGFIPKGPVPVTVPPPGDPKGLISPFGDIVREPSYRNGASQLMFATAGSPLRAAEVYGLFEDGSEPNYHWERIGTIPEGLQITATGSLSGRAVMIAASGGRIFLLNSAEGTASEQPVVLPRPAPATPQLGGNIPRILVLREDFAFAMLDATNLKNNYILRLEGQKWVVPLSIGLPLNAIFYALEGFVRDEGAIIFTATDNKVYMSEDAGDHWVEASGGLPRRSHCADLRAGIVDGETWLYLSTFGRSIWRAHLRDLNIG